MLRGTSLAGSRTGSRDRETIQRRRVELMTQNVLKRRRNDDVDTENSDVTVSADDVYCFAICQL